MSKVTILNVDFKKNMSIKVIFSLAIVCLLSFPNILGAQQIKQTGVNSYLHENKTYNFKELGAVIRINENAYRQYKLSQSLKFKTILPYSFITLGVATLGFKHETHCNGSGFCLDFKGAAHKLFWRYIVPVFGTFGIICHISIGVHKRKSIKMFNNHIDVSYLNNSETWDINIGQTNYGYGIVINF